MVSKLPCAPAVNTQHAHNGHAPDTDSRVRELVLGYLDDHPTAMDTLDGIAQWWIMRQQLEIEVRRVSSALTSLVREGVLEEFEQGGVRFFRRHHIAGRLSNGSGELRP